MVYCNTPLSNTMWSPMQILTSRSARSDLLISNAARKQLGIDCEHLRTKYKNEHLPLHDLHIDIVVMHQDSASKHWFLAIITRLCKEPRSYIMTTKDGVQYRKMQAHLKPYQPQSKKNEDEHVSQTTHMQTVKHSKSQKIENLAQSRPKRTLNPQLNWIHKEKCHYPFIRLEITCFFTIYT